MKILFKPFALIAGLIGARIGQKAFRSLWARIDDTEPPPRPTTETASLGKVVLARSLEGATMAAIGATVDRAAVNSFHYLTGIWPGPKTQEEQKQDEQD